ncbi:L,D-transpeptidase [Agrobacterium larrymoorei]|uniref:L,D-transpeptidase n=1 Tax=Agrobacterium larrymoorei TaxID=160699 RepID=A0A4D7E460_9HYPH|nr:L,D-transpeptidase [Agrobacterium larrymoorei]QCI99740.1 L,D-transpeptidase [Agrobacterium larrymoorei]QYA09827.1 L,D-transpeptidase [Agrobacterium larrymoorei]
MIKNETTRRSFLLGTGGLALTALGGCTTTPRETVEVRPKFDPYYAEVYGPKPDEQFPLPAIPYEKIDRRFYRQMVDNPTGERPGTIVVDTANHFLYLTYENNQAMRYGVGLGRQGFEWSGRGVIQYKRQWPRWTPPDEMIARQPELQPYSSANGGMAPGLMNPLGARALYIFKDGQDTIYRLHGSPEWWTIGKSVSSGCVRLMNQDIVDLYNRVPDGTPIVVTSLAPPAAAPVVAGLPGAY